MYFNLLDVKGLFATHTAVVLSIWMGAGGFDSLISMSFYRRGIEFWAVIKWVPTSALVAEVMTHLIIWAIVIITPFQLVTGSCSDRNMCTPALMWPLVSLWKPALE